MRTRWNVWMSVAVVVLASGLVVASRSMAEGVSALDHQRVNVEVKPIQVRQPLVRVPGANLELRRIYETQSQTSAIQAAADKLRDAASDEDKEAAKSEMLELLDEYFDKDMERRAEELAKVEERVTKLRKLLDTRKTKKDDIIDLQLKVLEYDANGLGMFTEPGGAGGGFGVVTPQNDSLFDNMGASPFALPGKPTSELIEVQMKAAKEAVAATRVKAEEIRKQALLKALKSKAAELEVEKVQDAAEKAAEEVQKTVEDTGKEGEKKVD